MTAYLIAHQSIDDDLGIGNALFIACRNGQVKSTREAGGGLGLPHIRRNKDRAAQVGF